MNVGVDMACTNNICNLHGSDTHTMALVVQQYVLYS